MGSKTSAVLPACTPILTILVVLWYMAVIILGILALIEDVPIRNDACGSESHIYKYGFINTAFTTFCGLSYCLFPGSGEAARARAVLCLIVHLALLTWGSLIMLHISNQCIQVLNSQFRAMAVFVYVCIAHNVAMGIFFFLHEVWLGRYIGFDLTLIAEFRSRIPTDRQDLSPASALQYTSISQPSLQDHDVERALGDPQPDQHLDMRPDQHLDMRPDQHLDMRQTASGPAPQLGWEQRKPVPEPTKRHTL